jgi:hypothetical protein
MTMTECPRFFLSDCIAYQEAEKIKQNSCKVEDLDGTKLELGKEICRKMSTWRSTSMEN